MTLPNVNRDWLIAFPSRNRLPVVWAVLDRSDPAKSINEAQHFIFRCTFELFEFIWTFIWNIEWDRDDWSFIPFAKFLLMAKLRVKMAFRVSPENAWPIKMGKIGAKFACMLSKNYSCRSSCSFSISLCQPFFGFICRCNCMPAETIDENIFFGTSNFQWRSDIRRFRSESKRILCFLRLMSVSNILCIIYISI